MHSKARWKEATLPYELSTEVPFYTYVERTDKYNIHNWWEWENGTICIIELPTKFHERCIRAVSNEVAIATRNMRSTNVSILNDGSTTTKTPRTGKKADDSWIPVAKPRLIRGRCDRSDTQPWPNLIIEVAYTQSEADVRTKAETYWLQAGKAHDVITIKIDEPIALATVPSVMMAWYYCINNRTVTSAFNPMIYEFGTINRNGAQIQLQPGQCVINIQLLASQALVSFCLCLAGLRSIAVIDKSGQIYRSFSNILSIDLIYANTSLNPPVKPECLKRNHEPPFLTEIDKDSIQLHMNQPVLYFNPEPFQDSEPLLEDCNAIYDKLIETTTKALVLLQEQKNSQ
ncbi:4598_t:CDS:2 [Funneliformis geosporum]|uniref:4598_t:CDS:1 n=1 Tax=Funneliformis geosporum TaxID=1117311 RepID=A0A9W4X4X3_9GLOM|nr:4598_t:CDS:2 [Funneliformis geosporum]